MSKATTLLLLALLLSETLSFAARPFSQGDTLVKAEAKDAEIKVEENCEGVGEEDCLMRRNLAAHLDYIYTQKTKP